MEMVSNQVWINLHCLKMFINHTTQYIYYYSGPSNVNFNKANESRTNVTELTKGVYIIGLTVTDGNGNNASNVIKITVYQSE